MLYILCYIFVLYSLFSVIGFRSNIINGVKLHKKEGIEKKGRLKGKKEKRRKEKEKICGKK